jgi:vacuolar-type H+-ATPase subunit F/Vma7
MAAIVFLGDEVTAAGFRLAGVSIQVPAAGEEQQALARALASARLVLLSAGLARRLPPDLVEQLRASPYPLVGILPDATGSAGSEDPTVAIRRHLGIATGSA